MTEPSKEEIQRYRIDYIGIKAGKLDDASWEPLKPSPVGILVTYEDHLKFLAKLRAEELENRIEELHKNYENTVGQGTQTIKDLRRDLGLAEGEITRLKAENERLKSEAGYHDAKDTISALESTVSALTKEVCDNKETIDRLTASLARAHSVLFVSRKAMEVFPKDFDDVLSDPTGKQAFERWKKMEAVYLSAKAVMKGWRPPSTTCNDADTDAITAQCRQLVRDIRKLEALDAKEG